MWQQTVIQKQTAVNKIPSIFDQGDYMKFYIATNAVTERIGFVNNVLDM
jgi:hypothetical protein